MTLIDMSAVKPGAIAIWDGERFIEHEGKQMWDKLPYELALMLPDYKPVPLLPEPKMLDRKVAELMEHFDSVRLFVTKVQDGYTYNNSAGDGNYFAQVGQIHLWLAEKDEEERDAVREWE